MKVLPSGRKLHHGPKGPRQKHQPFDGLCSGPLLAAARTAARKRSSPSGRSSIESVDSFGTSGIASREVPVCEVRMVMIFSSSTSSLKPYRITNATYNAMGRVVRAFAEIEDILTLHLCALSNISEGQVLILLGATPLSKKLKIARQFAVARGESACELFDGWFGTAGFQAALACRNVVAHGVFLGQTETGQLAFRTMKTLNADETTVGAEVVCYDTNAFLEVASSAELAIPNLEKGLQLQALRETRREQSLDPHSKAQPKRPPSTKPARPPKS